MPFPIALVLFALPFLELVGLIVAGQHFGALPVIAWVVISAAIGGAVMRHTGMATARRVQEALRRGEMPVGEMFDGAATMAGALLLILPGFLSDAVGLLLLVAPLRRALGTALGRNAEIHTSASGGATIIEGEYSVVSDPADPAAQDNPGEPEILPPPPRDDHPNGKP